MDKMNSLPVKFEKINLEGYMDSRFTPVKIYIAHTGENLNDSIFSKEVLESMIPSLEGIPILGYLYEKEGDIDFKAHEESLLVKNNELKIKYHGHAYGFVPKEHNAHFEMRYGEDGIEREYLVAHGILWNKFSDVLDIFERDSGFKPQSMELSRADTHGYLDENKKFVFTEAKFEGLCILGENVKSGMVSATIERFSLANVIKEEISEMMSEFNTHFSLINEKGDTDTMENEDKTLEEGKAEGEGVVEPVAEPASTEGEAANNFEATPNGEGEQAEPVVEPVVEQGEAESVESMFTRTFELSHDDIRSHLYGALDKNEQFSDSWYWISQVFDNHAIVENEDSKKFFKVNYVKMENAVSLGEVEEIFPMWLNQSEKTAIELSRTNFSKMEEELNTLKEFKSNIELKEKESVLSNYSANLTEEEYTEIKENLSRFSLDNLEKEIAYKLLKKNQFSLNEKNEGSNKVFANKGQEANPYGSLASYFN